MKVHLGSNTDIKRGWLNIDQINVEDTDFLNWDLSTGLPPQVQNVEIFYSSHFFEHLTWRETINLMRACRERMVDGGVFRMALPDFERLANAYVKRDWGFFAPEALHFAPDKQFMQIMNFSFYQRDEASDIAEHKQMFDTEYAVFTLKEAGFKECKGVPFNPDLDLGWRQSYTFYTEGLR